MSFESTSELAIRVSNVSKVFKIYTDPGQRLRQMLWNAIARLAPTDLRDRLHARAQRQATQFWALQDINLEVKRGQTIGVIGRNGSGKSTLLQIICGTLTPTTGTVEIHGRVAALLELGSGFNPEYTGRENVYFNAQLLGLQREQVDAKFDDIVAFADIGDFLDQPVKTYSSGMFVRLAFAVIAHVDADILVIDEALAVGDAFFTQKCMRFLREFMKTKTILFVSHDTSSIKSLCNAAIWLERGKMLEEGSPKEICELYLQAFYEAQQGKGTRTTIRPEYLRRTNRPKRDQRLDFINYSNLRNDMQVFEFDPEAVSFGEGGARIFEVQLLDSQGQALSWMVGGEPVSLRIIVQALVPLTSPIIGFFVKDRLGQTLFGDNTYLSYAQTPVPVMPAHLLTAEFSFLMPILAKGDYTICVAVADGTQADHVQHQWIHDALFFKSENSGIATGIIGLPIDSISLTTATPRENTICDPA